MTDQPTTPDTGLRQLLKDIVTRNGQSGRIPELLEDELDKLEALFDSSISEARKGYVPDDLVENVSLIKTAIHAAKSKLKLNKGPQIDKAIAHLDLVLELADTNLGIAAGEPSNKLYTATELAQAVAGVLGKIESKVDELSEGLDLAEDDRNGGEPTDYFVRVDDLKEFLVQLNPQKPGNRGDTI